jgi:hypothetical protein
LTSWLFLLVLFAVGAWGCRQFRRGKTGRLKRLYENEKVSTLARNWAVVAPWALALFAPILVLSSPVAGTFVDVPDRRLGFLIFATMGYLLLAVGFVALSVVSPPSWMYPKWAVPRSRPSAGGSGFDRIAIAIGGVLIALVGGGLLVVSAGALLQG